MQRHWSDSMFVWTCILLLLKLVMLHVCVWITSCCNNDRVPFSWLTHSLMTHRRLWSVATTLHDVHAPLHSATCFQLVVVQSPICCVHVFWGRPGSLRQFVPEQRPAKLHDSQCRNVLSHFLMFLTCTLFGCTIPHDVLISYSSDILCFSAVGSAVQIGAITAIVTA